MIHAQPDERTLRLARMAGQIADFFSAYPEEQAIAGIADHINRFWTRQMRTALPEKKCAGTGDWHPLVLAALPKIRRDARQDPAGAVR